MNRRGFLMGMGGSVLAAPAIVRVAANLMPIRAPREWTVNSIRWLNNGVPFEIGQTFIYERQSMMITAVLDSSWSMKL